MSFTIVIKGWPTLGHTSERQLSPGFVHVHKKSPKKQQIQHLTFINTVLGLLPYRVAYNLSLG